MIAPYWLVGLAWLCAGLILWWSGVMPKGNTWVVVIMHAGIGGIFLYSGIDANTELRPDFLRNLICGYALAMCAVWLLQGVQIRKARKQVKNATAASPTTPQ